MVAFIFSFFKKINRVSPLFTYGANIHLTLKARNLGFVLTLLSLPTPSYSNQPLKMLHGQHSHLPEFCPDQSTLLSASSSCPSPVHFLQSKLQTFKIAFKAIYCKSGLACSFRLIFCLSPIPAPPLSQETFVQLKIL